MRGLVRIALQWVAAFALGWSICGCAPASLNHPAEVKAVEAVQPVGVDVDQILWSGAMDAFDEGDYQGALSEFEVLSESAKSEGFGRKALFATAALRLALAQTPEEYSKAMALWQLWSGKAPAAFNEEDPRLLTPFLERLTPPPGTVETPQPQTPKKATKQIAYSNFLMCKNLLQVREKETERMKARLDAKEKEIRKLRHQIESLEKIHLKFQERKQEADSP